MTLRGSRFGRFWGCSRYPQCKGTHGAHPDGRPLGKPADLATKKARTRAHAAFDALWRGAHRGGGMTRAEAYEWLTAAMGSTEQVHIGALTIEECDQVVRLCLSRHFRPPLKRRA